MQQVSAVSPNTGPSDPASIRYVPVSNIVERYKNRKSTILGTIQIVIGVLCIIFNAVSLTLATYRGLGAVGHGFWCGIPFIITGVFGVKAGQLKTKCLIITFMVLCIISACLTIPLLAVGILGAVIIPTNTCSNSYYGYHGNPPSCEDLPANQRAVAMQSLLAICGFIEAIVAILGSTICCKSGACSCCGPTTMVAIPTVGYFPNNGQLICVAQGGQFAYAPNPMMSYPQGVSPWPAYGQQQQVWAMNPQQPMPTNASAPMIGQEPPAYYLVGPHNEKTEKTTFENFCSTE